VSDYRIVADYPHPIEKVWRALTEPALVPRWTVEGRGGTPVDFAPIAGTHFRLVAKPMPGWNGVVHCEVLEVHAPTLLRYTWTGDEGDDVTLVTYELERRGTGTRFTWTHTGFTGVGGFIVSKVLASARKKMLGQGLPRVLDEMGST
jgi:uncharacterized protein YndB with AHSA1/START domain